jgi:hypothetical protein
MSSSIPLLTLDIGSKLTILDTFDRYRYTVARDGTFEQRKVFAYIAIGFVDGKFLFALGYPVLN